MIPQNKAAKASSFCGGSVEKNMSDLSLWKKFLNDFPKKSHLNAPSWKAKYRWVWLPTLEVLRFLCPSEASLCSSFVCLFIYLFYFSGGPVHADTSKSKPFPLPSHHWICFSVAARCTCEAELPFSFRDQHDGRAVEIKQTFKNTRAGRHPQNQRSDPKLDGWPALSQTVHQQPNHRSDQLQRCSCCPLAFSKRPDISAQGISSAGIASKEGGRSESPRENAHVCHLMKDWKKRRANHTSTVDSMIMGKQELGFHLISCQPENC